MSNLKSFSFSIERGVHVGSPLSHFSPRFWQFFLILPIGFITCPFKFFLLLINCVFLSNRGFATWFCCGNLWAEALSFSICVYIFIDLCMSGCSYRNTNDRFTIKTKTICLYLSIDARCIFINTSHPLVLSSWYNVTQISSL